jgi:hypothetical protein
VITDRRQPGGWHIAADGTTTGPTAGGRRLCVLDDHTATDLIDLIQQIGTPPAAADPAAANPAIDPGPHPAPALPNVPLSCRTTTLATRS